MNYNLKKYIGFGSPNRVCTLIQKTLLFILIQPQRVLYKHHPEFLPHFPVKLVQ